MTKEVAELLNNYGGEIYDHYSGRGMYGKETVGIVFDTEFDFYNALAGCISDAAEDIDIGDLAFITDALRKLKSDNMGTGIIYY